MTFIHLIFQIKMNFFNHKNERGYFKDKIRSNNSPAIDSCELTTDRFLSDVLRNSNVTEDQSMKFGIKSPGLVFHKEGDNNNSSY